MTVTTEVKDKGGQLVELVKQVQAGNEVVLTLGNKPVARLVPTQSPEQGPVGSLKVHSFKGHRVLTPVISQAELVQELFERS